MMTRYNFGSFKRVLCPITIDDTNFISNFRQIIQMFGTANEAAATKQKLSCWVFIASQCLACAVFGGCQPQPLPKNMTGPLQWCRQLCLIPPLCFQCSLYCITAGIVGHESSSVYFFRLNRGWSRGGEVAKTQVFQVKQSRILFPWPLQTFASSLGPRCRTALTECVKQLKWWCSRARGGGCVWCRRGSTTPR